MADFNTALKFLLDSEGGYANASGDAGGETYAGIARRWHADWAGWSRIEILKTRQSEGLSLDTRLQRDVELQGLVRVFYNTTYWHFDSIVDQDVANKLLDWCVNAPAATARIVGNILGLAGKQPGTTAWGPIMLASINTMPPTELLRSMRQLFIAFRFDRVQIDATQQKFLKGWVLRDAR